MFAPLFFLFVLLYGIQAWPHEGKAGTEPATPTKKQLHDPGEGEREGTGVWMGE